MAEWPKAAVLKTASLKGDVGSNPTPSARKFAWQILQKSNFKRGTNRIATRKMKFRFKKFKVYEDSKVFCKSNRDIVRKHIRNPDKELALQIERALNSIVLNIAEGSADTSDIEFARVLGISIRSVYEVVAGFDLAALYSLITADQNEKIESDAHGLVLQLSTFRNALRKKG